MLKATPDPHVSFRTEALRGYYINEPRVISAAAIAKW